MYTMHWTIHTKSFVKTHWKSDEKFYKQTKEFLKIGGVILTLGEGAQLAVRPSYSNTPLSNVKSF